LTRLLPPGDGRANLLSSGRARGYEDPAPVHHLPARRSPSREWRALRMHPRPGARISPSTGINAAAPQAPAKPAAEPIRPAKKKAYRGQAGPKEIKPWTAIARRLQVLRKAGKLPDRMRPFMP
jgi:hypothetical protein